MPFIPRSQADSVPWTEVLTALDVGVGARALPARVRCPLCPGARLTIYEDTTSGGSWHHCFDCGHAGDLLELAAAVWKVSPSAALRRFRPALPAAAVKAYAYHHPGYRRRLGEFWETARQHLPRAGSEVLDRLRTKFRLTSQMSVERWLDGPGRLIGATHHTRVEQVFLPAGTVDGLAVSGRRAFIGRGWGDVLVIPFHDLPYRPAGFLCVGRLGRPEDHVFRRAVPIRSGHTGEAGLACLWAVENSHAMFGDKVVACGDPLLALRLHLRHFAAARTPLPLVAYHDGVKARTVRGWRALGHKTPVLWGWRVTPGLVYQAMAAGGELAVTPLTDLGQRHVDHFVRNAEPRTILRRVVAKAKPWRDFLADWAERGTDGMVEDLVIGLETYGVDPADLAALGPRFAAAKVVRAKPVTVPLPNKQRLMERDDQTWSDPPGKLPKVVMNAVLKIDASRVVAGSLVKLAGRLIYKGEEIPVEFGNMAQNKMLEAATRALALARPGAVLRVAAGWWPRIVDAARATAPGDAPQDFWG